MKVPAMAPGATQSQLGAPGAEMIKSGKDGGDGRERDQPADAAPEEDDEMMQFMAGVFDHPMFDLVAEDDGD